MPLTTEVTESIIATRLDPSGKTRSQERLLGVTVLATGVLTAFGYRGLFELARAPIAGVERGIEGAERFFFVASEASPGFAYPIFLWMLLNRRKQLVAYLAEPGPGAPAAVVVAVAFALGLWGYYVHAPTVLIPSLSLMLLGAGWLLGGWPAARALIVPAIFLFYSWPLPGVLVNAIVFPMQLAAADLATGLLSILGVPHILSGEFIVLKRGAFQVVETCSGLRSMQTLMMSAFVYSELLHRTGSRLVSLVLFAPIIAFFINGLRVLTIMLNPYSESIGVHTAQGILMIVVGVLLLAAVDQMLDWIPSERRRAMSRIRLPNMDPGANLLNAPRWGVIAAALIGLGIASFWMPQWRPGTDTSTRLLSRVPEVLGDWSSQWLNPDRTFLGTVRASDELSRIYSKGQDEIDLYVAEDNRIHPLLSLHSEKTALPGSGWVIEERDLVSLEVLRGREIDRLVLRSYRGDRQLVLYWRDGRLPLGVEVFRSTLALDRSPLRRLEKARAVRIATPIEPTANGREIAEERLSAFLTLLSETPLLSTPET